MTRLGLSEATKVELNLVRVTKSGLLKAAKVGSDLVEVTRSKSLWLGPS